MLLLRKCGILLSDNKPLMNILIDNGYYISPKEGKYGPSYEIFQLFEEDTEENAKES